MKDSNHIIQIVQAGGSVIIDSSKTTEQIKSIVSAAKPECEVIIRQASKKNTDQLVDIANAASCKVVFDLTD